MATNSAIVTALASSIQRKNAYRGNVQVIPVDVTIPASASSEQVTLSEVLPPNTQVLAVDLIVSALSTNGVVDVGYNAKTATQDLILDGVTATSAASVKYPATSTGTNGGDNNHIDVSGKFLSATVTGTDAGTLDGYILIVTDE